MLRSVAIVAVSVLSLAAGLFGSTDRAQAMSPAPAALAAAVSDTSLAGNVAYICAPRWRCGPYGCGWRQICAWQPGYAAYSYPTYSYGWGAHRWRNSYAYSYSYPRHYHHWRRGGHWRGR